MTICAFNLPKILQSASIISIVQLGKLGASVLTATSAPALLWWPSRPPGGLEMGGPLQHLCLHRPLSSAH